VVEPEDYFYDDYYYADGVYANNHKCNEWQPYALYVADLLQNNKKEEIENLLNDYLNLADKYAVSYRFEDKQWIDYVYNPPYYFADYKLSSESRYDNYSNKSKPLDHIIAYKLKQCMRNLIESQSNVIKLETVLIFLYIALFLAILIYAFRITSRRIWLMSFAGAIVVMLVYGAIYFLSMIGSVNNNNDGLWSINQCFVFILVFWLFTIFCLWKEKMKKFAGMTLSWCIVTLPCIFPLVLARYGIYLDKIYKNLPTLHPHAIWIGNHIIELVLLNILLFLVLLFLLMPVIKKWKALAEE